MKKSGFTLLELLIVIVIIGVLAVLFIPGFRQAKERALNDEARASLKLIQSAEKIYRMEWNAYAGPYTDPAPGPINSINNNLKLSLPNGTTRNWNYTIPAATATTFQAQGSRQIGSGYNRVFTIDQVLEEPTCTGDFCK